MIRLTTCIAAALWAIPAFAQTLTPSERAARDEQPSQEMLAQRARDCSQLGAIMSVKPGETINVPSLGVLWLMQITPDPANAGKFQVESFNPLPLGGIGGQDICMFATQTGQTPDAPNRLSGSGLVLRPGMDVSALYPNVAPIITQRGQLGTLAGGRYQRFGSEDELRQTLGPNAVILQFDTILLGRLP